VTRVDHIHQLGAMVDEDLPEQGAEFGIIFGEK
jgi:hypothetical protein